VSPSAALLDERWRHAQQHQSFFCEENVWHLVTGAGLPRPRAAVFVANDAGAVPMWGQRAAACDPLVWDYHVVALLPAAAVIVDLDDRISPAWSLDAWLEHAFRIDDPELAPRFRVVDEVDLRRTFSTDRSHMLAADGSPCQPLPPWPAPYQPALGMTLPRFLDPRDDVAGVVVDAGGLRRLCAASAPPQRYR
jgi:hypothetical protein